VHGFKIFFFEENAVRAAISLIVERRTQTENKRKLKERAKLNYNH